MGFSSRGRRHLALVIVVTALSASEASSQTFVAGTTPERRPDNAPTITVAEHNSAWLRRARRGIRAPYPKSLAFLNSQGDWYTPFTRRGMTGPYDIRRLHQD